MEETSGVYTPKPRIGLQQFQFAIRDTVGGGIAWLILLNPTG